MLILVRVIIILVVIITITIAVTIAITIIIIIVVVSRIVITIAHISLLAIKRTERKRIRSLSSHPRIHIRNRILLIVSTISLTRD